MTVVDELRTQAPRKREEGVQAGGCRELLEECRRIVYCQKNAPFEKSFLPVSAEGTVAPARTRAAPGEHAEQARGH